jgi:hypothetical protein
MPFESGSGEANSMCHTGVSSDRGHSNSTNVGASGVNDYNPGRNEREELYTGEHP